MTKQVITETVTKTLQPKSSSSARTITFRMDPYFEFLVFQIQHLRSARSVCILDRIAMPKSVEAQLPELYSHFEAYRVSSRAHEKDLS